MRRFRIDELRELEYLNKHRNDLLEQGIVPFIKTKEEADGAHILQRELYQVWDEKFNWKKLPDYARTLSIDQLFNAFGTEYFTRHEHEGKNSSVVMYRQQLPRTAGRFVSENYVREQLESVLVSEFSQTQSNIRKWKMNKAQREANTPRQFNYHSVMVV